MPVSNPASAKLIATGVYTGDDGDGRQVAVGFKCSLVILYRPAAAAEGVIFTAAYVWVLDSGAVKAGGSELHATDGFTVYATADMLNNSAVGNYYYWAISE